MRRRVGLMDLWVFLEVLVEGEDAPMQQGSEVHEECLHMALALEGIAGALHAGRRVHSQARGRMSHAANGCAAGNARDAATVELAAQDLARELRWMAHDLADRPPRTPAWEQAKVIRDLQSRYARFGFRPAAA